MIGDDNEIDEELEGAQDEEFDEESDDPEVVQQAAAAIEFVVLPIACTNEGRGAPLAMGIQRWWAQELASRGVQGSGTGLHGDGRARGPRRSRR
jgi:hypothetical protein